MMPRRSAGLGTKKRNPLSVIAFFLISPFLARGDEVTASAGGKVYHTRSTCPAVKTISPENKITYKSAEEAEADGRRLCRTCAKAASREAERGRREPSVAKSRANNDPPKSTSRSAEEPVPRISNLDIRVRKVHAGGSIVLENGEILVLLGTVCPLPGQELAEECRDRLEKIIRGKKARIEPDAWSGSSPTWDFLGRSQVYLRSKSEKADVGATLIREGLAWLDRDARFERRDEYIALEDEAWNGGRGIWKRLDSEAGQAKVFAGRHARSYHPPGCLHIAHLTGAAAITLNEAKARRLTPCEMDRMRDDRHLVPAPGDPASTEKVSHGNPKK